MMCAILEHPKFPRWEVQLSEGWMLGLVFFFGTRVGGRRAPGPRRLFDGTSEWTAPFKASPLALKAAPHSGGETGFQLQLPPKQ